MRSAVYIFNNDSPPGLISFQYNNPSAGISLIRRADGSFSATSTSAGFTFSVAGNGIELTYSDSEGHSPSLAYPNNMRKLLALDSGDC